MDNKQKMRFNMCDVIMIDEIIMREWKEEILNRENLQKNYHALATSMIPEGHNAEW